MLIRHLWSAQGTVGTLGGQPVRRMVAPVQRRRRDLRSVVLRDLDKAKRLVLNMSTRHVEHMMLSCMKDDLARVCDVFDDEFPRLSALDVLWCNVVEKVIAVEHDQAHDSQRLSKILGRYSRLDVPPAVRY